MILIVLLGLGGAFFTPRERQLAALAGATSTPAERSATSTTRRPTVVGIVGALSSLLILIAIFCMVAKPFAS